MLKKKKKTDCEKKILETQGMEKITENKHQYYNWQYCRMRFSGIFAEALVQNFRKGMEKPAYVKI